MQAGRQTDKKAGTHGSKNGYKEGLTRVWIRPDEEHISSKGFGFYGIEIFRFQINSGLAQKLQTLIQ